MMRNQSIGENGIGCTCSNRGIDGKNIFLDEADYEKFVAIIGHYLTEYISEERPGFKKEKPSLIEKKKKRNLAKEVSLLAFCLLPNGYELLVTGPATKFIRRVCTHYCMYFNRKYNRRGPLFEGRFKSRLVQKMEWKSEIERIEQLSNTKVVKRFGPITATITPIQRSKSEYLGKLKQIVKTTRLALNEG